MVELMRDAIPVSVVIPCYKAGRFVPRAIGSVEAALQAAEGGVPLRLAELIAVDDASGDDTVGVLEELAKTHPQLRILRNPRNLGPAGSRNAAIAAATGEWVAILDADDAFAPGRLSRLIGRARDEGLEVISDLPLLWDLRAGLAAPEQLDADGTLRRLQLADMLRPDARTGFDPGLMKPVFLRRLATEGKWLYPGEIRHGEDFALYCNLLRAGVGFGLLNEAHYIFSTRIGAHSGSFSPGSVTNVDFRAIAAHAAAMQADWAGDPVTDPALIGMLRDRQARALAQNRAYGWTVLRKREWRRLWQWLRKDARNAGALARVIAAKLGGQRGRPV